MSFIGFCGIFACCVSGFITSRNFGNKANAIKCAYERIYYDSNYGEIKKSDLKWEGLVNRNNEGGLINNFKDFLGKDNKLTTVDIFIKTQDWEIGKKEYNLDENVYYKSDFVNILKEEILDICIKSNIDLYEGNRLICDKELKDPNSIVMNYIKEATRISKIFNDEINKINEFVTKDNKEKQNWNNQINNINITLGSISNDLDNYQNNYLDKAHHYLKISNIFGKILVVVFYSILIAIIVISCFLLWAYTFFKEQKLFYLFMHIAWNILKFFSFCFFFFGGAFGALYLISRDLIGYNEFLFSNSNLAKNETTSLLPENEAKEFLRYCVNEEDTNYINNFDISLTKILRDLYYNMKAGKDIKENYNYESLIKKATSNSYSSANQRMLEETDLTDMTDEIPQSITLNFTKVTEKLQSMINELYDKLNGTKSSSRNLEESTNYFEEISKLDGSLGKLNCYFIKNELEIIYDSLYELSIESRISCALCCCIAFFDEFAVAFFLLVLYHYNNNEFKEGNETTIAYPKNRNKSRKFDMDSQNEFMDKSRPVNMRKNNKKLDLEYNSNQ